MTLVLVATGATFHPRAGAQISASAPSLPDPTLDSIRVALGSEDVDARQNALERLVTSYAHAVPASVTPALLVLLSKEAAVLATSEEDNEDYGEYIINLVVAATRTQDPRAIPDLLRIGGPGVSSEVSAFIARQGASQFNALDAYATTRSDCMSDVLEIYTMMYTRYAKFLSRDDSVRVLRRLLAAATHPDASVRAQLASLAGLGPVPELLPVVTELAASDPYRSPEGVYFVRHDANGALPRLQQARAASSTSTLLDQAERLTDAVCDAPTGKLGGQCTALTAHLATAARHITAAQSQPAQNALDAYRRTVQRLEADGLIPHLTAVSLDGSAAAVAARL